MKRDWRCSGCGILLAKIDDDGLAINRGNLQAVITGKFQVSAVCYRPRCRTLNVLQMTTEKVEEKARQLRQ